MKQQCWDHTKVFNESMHECVLYCKIFTLYMHFFSHFCVSYVSRSHRLCYRWRFMILVQMSLWWLLVESGTKWWWAANMCTTWLSPHAKGESSNCLKMQAFKPTHAAGRQKKISLIDLKSTGPILRYLAFLTLLDSHFIAIDFIAKTSNCKED